MSDARIVFDEKTGLWWPDNTSPEAGYEYMIKRVTDVDVAVKYCRKTAVAVQAGGNVGMWARRLAKFFETVHVFEPVPVIYGALCHNVRHLPQVLTYDKLLTDEEYREVAFSVRSGGVSRVVPNTESHVLFEHTTTIDALKLPCCDALFLDVEGHELHALKGAMETISKFRPVITVEVWDHNQEAYRDFFDALHYERVAKVHGDEVYVPRSKG